MRAPLVLLVATAMVSASSASRADYGDLPAQPGDADYVAPAPAARAGSTPDVHFELSAAADYLAPPIRGGTNPFGFGFGGSVSMMVAHVYASFTAIDYLGGTDVTLSDQSLLLGGELGYGFVLREDPGLHLTVELRPSVGIGNAAITHTDPSLVTNAKPDVVTTASGRVVSGGKPSDSITVNSFFVRPKLALVLRHEWHFVALEVDALVLPSIGYAGADPATWITYGAQLRLGAFF